MAREEFRVDLEADNNISKEARKAKDDLDKIPDRVETTVEVDSKGFDDLSDKIGSMPGQLGDIGGALSSLGGAGAAGGLAAVMVSAANAQADMAIDAQTTADLTGATVEEASKLQTLWSRSGADVNDLNDVLLQMNGALAQSPELAKQIGVNLNDGKDITQRFVEVTDKLASGQLTAQQASQLFGEEGVRQVGKLRTLFGALGDDIESIEAPITDADVADAIQYKKSVTELTDAIKMAGGVYAKQLVSAFGDIATLADQIAGALPGGTKAKDVLGFVQQWGTGLGVISGALDAITGDTDDATAAAEGTVDVWGAFGRAVDDAQGFVKSAAVAGKDYSDAQSIINDEISKSLGLLQEQRTAFQEMSDARRAAADSTFAVRDAERDYATTLAENTELIKEAPGMTLENAAALDETALAAGRLADANVQLATESGEAMGVTMSATDAQKTWNTSMLTSARSAEGPLQSAIVDYIATVNGIPPEKVSEILANPDYATIEEAAAAIDEAAAARDAEIIAAARTAEAEKDLDHVARDRDMEVRAHAVRASGWNVISGGFNAATTSSVTATGRGVATPAGTVAVAPTAAPIVVNVPLQTPNVTINTAVIGNRYDTERTVARSLNRYQRRNGKRP